MRFRPPGHTAAMGFAVGIVITAVGFVLALAVHPTHPGAVDVNSVGWILVVVGLIALLADLLLWSSWGPGYMRRTYVERGPGYGPYPPRSGYGYPSRRTIEEEEVGRQGPRY